MAKHFNVAELEAEHKKFVETHSLVRCDEDDEITIENQIIETKKWCLNNCKNYFIRHGEFPKFILGRVHTLSGRIPPNTLVNKILDRQGYEDIDYITLHKCNTYCGGLCLGFAGPKNAYRFRMTFIE